MAQNDTLVIFGNGLGMAIDPTRFSISEGLKFAWEKLDEKDKLLLSTLKGISPDKPPQTEKELKSVEEICILPLVLESIADDPDAWLSNSLKTFPTTVSNFRKHVADYFIEQGRLSTIIFGFTEPDCGGVSELWESFGNSLLEFIASEKPHVATLNYDALLYELFVDQNVPSTGTAVCCPGRNAKLADGLLPEGFLQDIVLDGTRGRGRYLHLHGSALFYTEEGKIKKHNRSNYSPDPNVISHDHIVLTDHDYKRFLIDQSPLLSAYWKALEQSIHEVQRVILFGYGGLDTHLNDLFHDRDLSVTIVQWDGSQETKQDWQSRLQLKGFNDAAILEDTNSDTANDRLEVIQFDNILKFDDWG